jgi:hypothetical protein
VRHDLNPVAQAGPAEQPIAEPHIHGPVSESMGNPLNQKTAWSRKPIELLPDTPQIGGRHRPQIPVNSDSLHLGIRAARRPAPHLYVVPLIGQAGGHQVRIVAHAAGLRRVFADDVPGKFDNVPFDGD